MIELEEFNKDTKKVFSGAGRPITTESGEPRDKTVIIKLTESELEEIDTYKEKGFSNRSDYIRHKLFMK